MQNQSLISWVSFKKVLLTIFIFINFFFFFLEWRLCNVTISTKSTDFMLTVNNAVLNYKCSLKQEGGIISKPHNFWLSEAVKMADKGHYHGAQKRGKYLFGNRVRQTKHRDRHSLCEVQSYSSPPFSPSHEVVTKTVMIKYLQT